MERGEELEKIQYQEKQARGLSRN